MIMTRRLLILCLAFAIVLTPLGPAVYGKKDQTPDKVKAEVESRINKKEEHVKIRLRSGSQVRGRITQTSDNGFTVIEDKSGTRTEIAYADVSNLEGRGMSKTKKTLIGVGIGTGVFIALVAYALTHFWD
jgi:small nuclear ribonucleoprotein (snRNP)-like protein